MDHNPHLLRFIKPIWGKAEHIGAPAETVSWLENNFPQAVHAAPEHNIAVPAPRAA